MDSSAPEEEDWESAGLNMENFKLVEPIVPKSKPAFIMPARLLSRPIIGDINFLHDFPPVMSQVSSSASANSSGSQFAPSAAADSPDQVDSALISAIENPRERMQVLNLENVLLLFVKSSERSIELPPEHNSFRRLLAYRIARRFGLTHAVSDQLNENGERGILIYRTPDTRVPSPLLIDLPPPNEFPSDQSPFGSSQNLQEAGIESAAPVVAKKMTMMKRNPNRDNDVKKESLKKEKQTAEEREKAYAEARARIFGAEAEAAATSAALGVTLTSAALKKSTSDSKIEKTGRAASPRPGSASPSPPLGTGPNIANPAAASNTKKKVVPAAGKKSPGPDSVPVVTSKPASKDQVRSAASASPPPVEAETVKVKKKTVDVTAWKEKKFTVRDQDAERSDPDFSRRNVPSNNSGRGAPQHGQYSQQSQFRGAADDQLSSYQQSVQIQGGPGMAAQVGPGYQQGYQAPQDPYQYGQNGNGMMPFGPPGGHNPYIQGPFGMQMGHMGMGAAPTSPPQQQQWQQARPQGVMMNQHPGNPYYPHLPSGVNMAAIHPPLGQMPLPMNMGIYSPIQGQGHGPIPGGYGNGPYGPLGNLYPPLPSTTNISNNTYSNLSAEQHQNPPSV